MNVIPDQLTRFVMHLDVIASDEQQDAFMNEAMETGGTFDPADEGDGVRGWALIKLHGCTSIARNNEDAIGCWKQCAQLKLKIGAPDDIKIKQQEAKLNYASQIMRRPNEYTDAQVANACEDIQLLSGDVSLISRATSLMQTVTGNGQ